MIKSLVWSNNKGTSVIGADSYSTVSDDLDLSKIFSLMSREPYIKITPDIFLGFVTDNTDDIFFRQCILQDMTDRKDIPGNLFSIISDIDRMKELHKTLKSEFIVPSLILRYKKLQVFQRIMSSLEKIFQGDGTEGKSDEYRRIADSISEYNAANRIAELGEDLVKIGRIIIKTKSLDLGANVDDTKIREAVVLSVNDFSYDKTSMIDKIKSGDMEKFEKSSIATELDIRNAGYLLAFQNEIYEDLGQLLKNDFKIIESVLDKYKDIITSNIIAYRDELCFYYGALRLLSFIKSNGFPVSYAKPGARLKVENIYSLHMLCEKATGSSDKYSVVQNSVDMKEEEEVLLITGPNNGGKTVLVQSLGLAQLMFQNGIFVPMSTGTMPLYSSLHTHFPKDEDIDLGTGRLGEEAARVSKIYRSTGANSLVIFNEPYITTSPIEGLDILLKSLEKFRARECTVYLVTHYLDILLKSGKDDVFASYAMEIKDGIKTYRALRRPPLEKSYAMELAVRNKVDARGLVELAGVKREN